MFVVHPHKLVVTLDPSKNMSEGGIVLPESADEVRTATIVACGDDQPFDKNCQIIVPKENGVPFRYEGVNYVVIHKDAVIVGLLS